MFPSSDYVRIMKLTRKINKVLKTKIIFHTSLIQRALDGGRRKYQKFADSEEGKQLINENTVESTQKALNILLGDEKTDDGMSEEEVIRRELFSLNPDSISSFLINKANKYGEYPIVMAAHNKDIKLVKFLYDVGQRLDVTNDDGKDDFIDEKGFYTQMLRRLVEEGLNESWSTKSENPDPGLNAIQAAIAEYKPAQN